MKGFDSPGKSFYSDPMPAQMRARVLKLPLKVLKGQCTQKRNKDFQNTMKSDSFLSLYATTTFMLQKEIIKLFTYNHLIS